MKEDQQNNATNQAWKHKKGYGSTFFLLVVAIGGLVAVITKGNSHRAIVTSPVDNNLIRIKHDKVSSTYEDTCLRNDLTKEELATTVSFLQDEYMVPYLKTSSGRKEFMDSIVVSPAVVPSDVQVLDPSDDSPPSIFSTPGKAKCSNIELDLFKILSHVGSACYRADGPTLFIRGEFFALGNKIDRYEYRIGNDTRFLLFKFNHLWGKIGVTFEASFSGRGYMRFCSVQTGWFGNNKTCSNKLYFDTFDLPPGFVLPQPGT